MSSHYFQKQFPKMHQFHLESEGWLTSVKTKK